MEKFGNVVHDRKLTLLETLKDIFYRIDWRNRKLFSIRNWLKEQINDPTNQLLDLADDFNRKFANSDKRMIEIKRYVLSKVFYETDLNRWGTPELWNTAQTTLDLGEDDCEGFAVLIFVIGRLSGIPANRLLLTCGSLKNGGGHAYLLYGADYDGRWYIIDGTDRGNLRYIPNCPRLLEDDRYVHPYWWCVNDEKCKGKFKLVL